MDGEQHAVTGLGPDFVREDVVLCDPMPPYTVKFVPTAVRDNATQSPEFREFNSEKLVVFKGGPFDGANWNGRLTDEFGLLYFFRNNGYGEIEQCVYRIVLQKRDKPVLAEDATDEEKQAWRDLPSEWDWVGEFVGKRRCPKKEVSGVRKG